MNTRLLIGMYQFCLRQLENSLHIDYVNFCKYMDKILTFLRRAVYTVHHAKSENWHSCK